MKRWALTFALVFLAGLAHAATFQPTVNPLLPTQNSPLASSVVRGNFQNTYNDLVSVAGLIHGGVGTVVEVTCNITSPGSCSVLNPNSTPAVGIVLPLRGNGNVFQMGLGATTSGDCARFDTNGNLIDGGLCSGGGGAVTWPSTHSLVISNSSDSPVGLNGTAGQVLQFNGASADPTAVSTLSSTVQGNITTLGTIGTGVWQGTVIGATYLPVGSDSAKGILQCDGVTATCPSGIITATGSGSGVALANTTSNLTYYLGYTTTTSGSLATLYGNSGITVNPSTSVVTATTFAGNASTATTATNATNAVNTALTNTTSNVSYFLNFTTTTNGNLPTYGTPGLVVNASSGNFSIPTGGVYQINGTQIACTNLSNGATGCSTATGTSGATIPLLNGTNTWSGVQSFNSSDLVLKGSSSGTTVLNSGAAAGSSVLTLPIATDTLMGKATTDTLTNKTYDTAGTGNSFSINGLAATANSGTGAVVRVTSAALVTPDLGTPSALVLTNASGLPTAALPANQKIRAISYTIDGGGSTITTGIKGDLQVPFACTITRATLLADQSGSIVVNVWKDTVANYPPTVADKITASAPPTITTATNSTDATLSGWTTSITALDTLRFNVDSVTTITRVTLMLSCNAT